MKKINKRIISLLLFIPVNIIEHKKKHFEESKDNREMELKD